VDNNIICTLQQPIFVLCFHFPPCLSIKGILLCTVFVLGTVMMHLNNKNNRYVITAAATIFTLAIMTTSIMAATPAAATTTTTTTTTTSREGAEILELSPQPVLRERQITISQTPINQTHVLFTDSGNGTITLPNTTEAIDFTGTDSVVVSIVDGTAVGKEVFTTLDGSETVNGTVFAIARFNIQDGTGKGIVTLLLQTNSTGRLAPVDDMILAGHIEFYPDGSAESTMWEWQSGIPLPSTATTETTTTNTTAAGVGGQEEATIEAGEGQLSPEEEQQAAGEAEGAGEG
jgi:hypothetical protein